MGQSASNRVKTTLENSPEFISSCNSVYTDCLTLTQHAFNGVKPYQLLTATEKLHTKLLSNSFPLISKWVPLPPNRNQVDRAVSNSVGEAEGELLLDDLAFKAFAVQVFTDAVVSSAGLEVLKRVPLGAAGIGVLGAVVKPGHGFLFAAIGAYALGVASSVYIGLAHG